MLRVILWLMGAVLCLVAALWLPPVTYDLRTAADKWESKLGVRIADAEQEFSAVRAAEAASADWPETKTAFYLADSTGLIRWNTFWLNPVWPAPADVKFALTSTRRGDFLVIHHQLNGCSLDAVIPLVTFGPHSEKVWLEGSGFVLHPVETAKAEPVRIGEEIIFWISTSGSPVQHASLWSWLFLVMSAGASVVAARLWMASVRNAWLALGPVFALITSYRWVMTATGLFPGSRPGNDLFDPARFAGFPLQDSAGDFLINVVCLLVMVLMVRSRMSTPLLRLRSYGKARSLRSVIHVLPGLIFFMLVFLFPQLLMEVVYRHSQATLDLTETLQTDALRLVLFLAVVAAMMIVFLTARLLGRWLSVRMLDCGPMYWWVLLFAAAVVFGLFSVAGQVNWGTWLMALLTVAGLSAGTFWRRRFPVLARKDTAAYFLVVTLAASAAWNVRTCQLERDRQQLVLVRDELDNDRDEFGTYLLATAADSLGNDPLVRFAVDNPAGDKRLVLSRLESEFGAGYFSEYDFSAGFFKADGTSYAGWTDEPLEDVLSDFQVRQLSDTLNLLGFIRPLNDQQFRKRFLAIVPVGKRMKGHLVILLQKSIVGYGVHRSNPLTAPSPGVSGVARWKNGRMVTSAGWFAYDDFFASGIPAQVADEFTSGGARHVLGRPAPDEVLVVSGDVYRFSRLMTVFSLFVCLGFILVLVPVLAIRIRGILTGQSLSYASRIRWYLFAAFVLPLTALAATAVFSLDYFTREKATIQRREAAVRLSAAIEKIWLDSADQSDIRRIVLREAAAAGSEVALYGTNGAILFTSRPVLLADGWIAPRVGYPVLKKLRQGAAYAEYREKIGSAGYLSGYSALRSGIIIGLPDFAYSHRLEKDAIAGLTVVLPVAVVVFLLFLIFSEAMLFRLTSPIREVTLALRRTSLAGGNPRLLSTGSDEMGEMVRSYNDMLGKLEQSRRELAERERESVWREMARRVAHEIRNPLTPIRLAIQRMQMQLAAGTIKAEPAREALEGILHQTAILNDIATSFSTLAHQPPLVPEAVPLAAAVREAVAVFTGSPEGSVTIAGIPDDVVVSIDRTFLSRTVSNLILNAFQSSENPVMIRISAASEDDAVLLTVEDNGPGIDPQIIGKIFDPYFTTRKTGTGLGLTLVRHGLEECGGSIEVASEPGHGATFRIRMRRG